MDYFLKTCGFLRRRPIYT